MGRTFASLHNYQVDGNKEMIAIGFMNIVGCCFSCYVTTGNYFLNLPQNCTKNSKHYKFITIYFKTTFRVFLSICCKLQCWGKDYIFKYCYGSNGACNSAFSHATVSLHTKLCLSSNYHNSCCWTDRLQGCIAIVEA